MAVAAPLAKPQKLQLGQLVRVGVLGASGYTGAEVSADRAAIPFVKTLFQKDDLDRTWVLLRESHRSRTWTKQFCSVC